MAYPIAKYQFQFNNDEDSCVALKDLIAKGWTISGYKIEDGFTWFMMIKERYQ